jgi:AcrR family transcriptional regulator
LARPRAATYDDQREQILARAAELFARQGYTATTMNQVAAACGVTKPTLYHYWRDKQSLLLHIAAGHVARLEALCAEVQAAGCPPQRGARPDRTLHAGLRPRPARTPRADRGRALPARRARPRCWMPNAAWWPALPTPSPRCGPTCRRSRCTSR